MDSVVLSKRNLQQRKGNAMKQIQNKHYRMMLFCLISLAWAIMFRRFPIVAYAETEVVRVGYYENEVFQEGAGEGEVKSGYAYDYYRKLSE